MHSSGTHAAGPQRLVAACTRPSTRRAAADALCASARTPGRRGVGTVHAAKATAGGNGRGPTRAPGRPVSSESVCLVFRSCFWTEWPCPHSAVNTPQRGQTYGTHQYTAR